MVVEIKAQGGFITNMSQIVGVGASGEMNRPSNSRTQSFERRGRSTSTRNFQDYNTSNNGSEMKLPEYQFRPPEVVKNIQKINDSRPPSTSRSRETSNVRREASKIRTSRDHLSNMDHHIYHQTAGHDGKRSSSIVSVNYKVSRVHSNLNPNATPNITNRYKTPMSAYSSNEAVDTIVPNHSNILYQKYQRPSIVSKNSHESKISTHNNNRSNYQTPKSHNSVSMGCHDLVPAFNDLTMELGEAMNENIDDHNNKEHDIFEIDNKFSDSQPASTKSNANSENSSLNDVLQDNSSDITRKNSLSEILKEDVNQKFEKQQHKGVEKFGRIQQRVNYLKQMKDSEESNSTSKWKNLSIEQKMFFESLNNDLRNLKRSNYKPLHDSLIRTNRELDDNKLLDSSASITSQYLLKTYNPMKNQSVTTKPQHQQQHHTNSIKPREPDIPKLKSLLSQSNQIAQQMWISEKEHPLTSQTTSKSERLDKSSIDTAFSSLNSDSLSVKLVTHTYEPKDLDAIKESFDGYEINQEATTKENSSLNDSKHPSPLTQRV